MGQTLSEPSTAKHTSSGQDERLAYAVSEMQGWRISMEDAHATELDLVNGEGNAFFAVYDGHGGGTVARYAGEHVHQRLAKDVAYQSKEYEDAFKKAFLGTDDDLRSDPAFSHDPSGCTAVAAVITKEGKIICANAGDSRCVLSVKGEAKPLSYDHKPQNIEETQRIRAAGGYVEFNRVNGNLALSRAIGDFEFKQNLSIRAEEQIVTSDPEIMVHDGSEEDEFLVLACDGIWDCMTSQDVISWVRNQIALGTELPQICEDIMTRCLSPDSDVAGGIGCDNMTAMVIAILRGRTMEEWYAWVKERVEKQIGFETPRTYASLYPERQPYRRFGADDTGASPLGGGGSGAGGGPGGEPPGFLSASWLQRLNNGGIMLSNTGFRSLMNNSGVGLGNYDDSEEEYEEEDGERIRPVDIWGGWEGEGEQSDLHAPPSGDEGARLRSELDGLAHGDDSDDAMDVDHEGAKGSPTDGPYDPLNPRGPQSIGSPIVPTPSSLQGFKDSQGSSKGDAESASKGDQGQAASTTSVQGEAPPPPIPVEGQGQGIREDVLPEQHKSLPGGDEPSAAVKADGLEDTSKPM